MMQLDENEEKASTTCFNPEVHFHPDFSSEDANLILASKDAKLHFRVHLFTMKTTSGFFRAMFSLPQPDTLQSPTVYLDEDAEVLEHLLRMVCGLPILKIGTHELLQSLLFTAEKYDMPGPMSILRMYVMKPSEINDPIRLYAIARRYGWEQEAKALSTDTLVLNIFDPAHRAALGTLSSDAMLDLFTLHRSRKENLLQRLNNSPFVLGDSSRCIRCETAISYQTWRELKYKILMEIEQRPMGDTIVDGGLSVWPEATAAWRAACPNEGCKRLLYDRVETMRVIKECIEELPKTV